MSANTNDTIVEDLDTIESEGSTTNVRIQSQDSSVPNDMTSETNDASRLARSSVVIYIGDTTQNERDHAVTWDINNTDGSSDNSSTTNEDTDAHANCSVHPNNEKDCDDASDTTRCNCNCHTAVQNTVSYSNPAFHSSQANITDTSSGGSISAPNIDKDRFQSSKSLPKYSAGLTLRDEPPKYEDVTGKQLATQLVDKHSQNTSAAAANARSRNRTSGNLKRRIAGAGIFLAVLVVTILLIYLSITGATGNLSQNDSGNQVPTEQTQQIRPR